MKVCRIITRLNVGGPALQVKELNKLSVETLVLSGKLEEGEYGEEGQIRTMGRSIQPWDDFKAYRAIKQELERFKPDIVHTHTSKAGFLGRFAAWRLGIRCVHTYHGHCFYGYWGRIGKFLYRMVEKLLATITTKIIAISNSQESELRYFLGYKKDKIIRIYNGYDLSKFINPQRNKQSARFTLGLPKNDFIDAFIGRLVPVKNLKGFIEYAKGAREYTFLVVGDGPERDLIPDWMIHIPYCEDMSVVYRAVDRVSIYSFNEGTPTVYIEAKVTGTEVKLRSPVGGLKDLQWFSRDQLISRFNADRLRRDIMELYESLIPPD